MLLKRLGQRSGNMLPRHISGVNINNPELNRSQERRRLPQEMATTHRTMPRFGSSLWCPKRATVHQLFPLLLVSSLLLPTYIPPFFCPQKVHYSHGAVGSQGRSAALYCASRFPLSSRNTIQQRRKLKDEMEDGGKRSRGVTDATATMRRWTMDSG